MRDRVLFLLGARLPNPACASCGWLVPTLAQQGNRKTPSKLCALRATTTNNQIVKKCPACKTPSKLWVARCSGCPRPWFH